MTLTTDPGTTERPHFPTWRQVPEGVYATKTQLKGMDLPREPGPPAASVEGYDGLGRRTTPTLYRVDESEPTSASAAQLVAAHRRAGPAARECADCQARPERAPALSEDGPLCPACWHIRTLRTGPTSRPSSAPSTPRCSPSWTAPVDLMGGRQPDVGFYLV
ncbi:hypothetical protein OIE63_39175 (plasmid) [Streptomyces sp. NBC_01795]|uniref:hypothetical protein n=1 Tax=unclassified Streptomyces TaxID=2593676 RepID=UPI002DD96ADE|nr:MULTISPECIES: hypothetical protein [unclassified Streptomyces]WSA97553.1 hypothetical protein OIE63_39175 [Streptomyces sp. NBC_01795]WSB82199.1 hypothetical protein OHB04_41640 [Streptomyces sp. NBC_01775]WSS18170.1 hypothetical protein OG533_40720 [Streptomyces sp. NBC_01186]